MRCSDGSAERSDAAAGARLACFSAALAGYTVSGMKKRIVAPVAKADR
jgi:hypothetical protein